MTDRELLELAAKAHGSLEYVAELDAWINIEPDGSRCAWWHPLTDDGDAFRLAVKLRMGIHYETQFHADEMTDVVEVFYMRDEDGSTTRCIMQELGADADAATRRAIVRAAAEIGRATP